jgi:hypothetical protein
MTCPVCLCPCPPTSLRLYGMCKHCHETRENK